jgi:hypothetical protein
VSSPPSTPHPRPPADDLLGPDQGDMGLGLCTPCVVRWKNERDAGTRPKRTPNWAVCLSPIIVPVRVIQVTPDAPPVEIKAPVAVGHCLDCVPAGARVSDD